jgi:hypothetical protein
VGILVCEDTNKGVKRGRSYGAKMFILVLLQRACSYGAICLEYEIIKDLAKQLSGEPFVVY